MSFVIAEPCVDNTDQTCVSVCPADCIAADPSVDRKFYIDPAGCIGCGACESACPNGAIYRVEELPAEWSHYAWIDATWFADPDTARLTLDSYLPAA